MLFGRGGAWLAPCTSRGKGTLALRVQGLHVGTKHALTTAKQVVLGEMSQLTSQHQRALRRHLGHPRKLL